MTAEHKATVAESGEKVFGEIPVVLGEEVVHLPLRRINGVTLIHLDSSLPHLQCPCAREIARLAPPSTEGVGTPGSTKSIDMLEEACDQMPNHPQLFVFPKGKPGSPEMQTHLENAAFQVNFMPITAAEELIMVASHEQVEALREMDLRSLLLADDVQSKGGTLRAMIELFALIYDVVPEYIAQRVPIATVAYECPVVNGHTVFNPLPNSSYAVQIPTFPGEPPSLREVMSHINYPKPPRERELISYHHPNPSVLTLNPHRSDPEPWSLRKLQTHH